MRSHLRIGSALAAALLLSTSCKTPQGAGPGVNPEGAAPTQKPAGEVGPIRLSLVATNDLHGWVHANETRLPSGDVVEEGGLSNFAGYLAILRAENPGGVLLLDGGDLFQGTLASNLTEGEIVIEAMNALGYTAAALGNHEFDYGPVGPISVASEPGMDPFGALKARLKHAKFPMLAQNIYDARTGARPEWLGNDGSAIVETRGVKVGLLGLITPSTPVTTNPVNVSTLRFGSLVPEAVEGARRLREKGAEVVIVIAHAGSRCSRFEDPKDTSSCDKKDSELFGLLENIPAGTFDAVIAGHTHSEMAHVVNGMPVVETRGLGRSFGRIDLFVDRETRKVQSDRTVIHRSTPICGMVDEATRTCESFVLKGKKEPLKLVPATFMDKPIVPDAALSKLIAPALDRVRAEQQRKLGVTVPVTMGRNYEGESALGDFLADSLRMMDGADVALLNPGGLRADLPAGELTYGDVYEVIPFDNTVATITVTGEELNRLMHAAYAGKKGVFQISGLKVKIAKCPGQGRLKSFTLADGKPIAAEKRYRVVVPDFLARGGDGLGPVTQSLPVGRIDLGMSRELNFRDALVAHWQKKASPLVAPSPGRITFVDTEKKCEGGDALSTH